MFLLKTILLPSPPITNVLGQAITLKALRILTFFMDNLSNNNYIKLHKFCEFMIISPLDKRINSYIEAVQKVWDNLRNRFSDLPNSVIIIFSKTRGKRFFGHFAPALWAAQGPAGRHEVAINPRLFSNKYQTLGVILHEAAHAILYKRKIRCTNSYYHLKNFRNFCRNELHLNCEWRNTRYGWTDTSLSESIARKYYAGELKCLENLPFTSENIPNPKWPIKKLPLTQLLRAYCKCNRKITATKSNFIKGPIICGKCNKPFKIKTLSLPSTSKSH